MGPCRRMMRAGFCKYGASCFYNHDVSLPEVPSFPLPCEKATDAAGDLPVVRATGFAHPAEPEAACKQQPVPDVESPDPDCIDSDNVGKEDYALVDNLSDEEFDMGNGTAVVSIVRSNLASPSSRGLFQLSLDRAFMLWRMEVFFATSEPASFT